MFPCLIKYLPFIIRLFVEPSMLHALTLLLNKSSLQLHCHCLMDWRLLLAACFISGCSSKTFLVSCWLRSASQVQSGRMFRQLCFNAIAAAMIGSCLVESFIQDDNEMKTFVKTTKELLQKVVNEFKIIRIISYGNSSQLDDEMNEIIRSSNDDLVFEVLKNVNNKSSNCFLMFDSLEDYDKGLQFSRESLVQMKILVNYIRNATFDEISSKMIKTYKQNFKIFEFHNLNMYVLHRNATEFIDLVAIKQPVRDSKEECQQMWMRTVNRFSIARLEWQQPLQLLKLIENFHGCTINIDRTSLHDGFMIGSSKHKFSYKQGNHTMSGYMIEVYDVLAKIGNFNIVYDYIEDYEQESKQHNIYIPKLTAEQMNENIEEALLSNLMNHFPTSLIYKELYFTIPPADLYTEWEILFMAFDVATWSMISLTLMVAFIAIAIIRFTSQSVRNFVFGENVSTPSLNILAAFFGVSQTVLPKRNFARFLLMAFIMWSLLIRTCYVSVMFEYLKGDGRKVPIKSIDEMLDRNFTYFVFLHHCEQMGIMKFKGK